MNYDTNVDFDFFDTPRVQENQPNHATSSSTSSTKSPVKSKTHETGTTGKAAVTCMEDCHDCGGAKRGDFGHGEHQNDQSHVKRIEAHVPTVSVTVKEPGKQRQSKDFKDDDDNYNSDSFDNYSTESECSDMDNSDNNSDTDYPPRPRSGCKAPTPTSGRRGKRSGSSDCSLQSEDDMQPVVKIQSKQKIRHTKRHKSSITSEHTGSKQVTRGRAMAITIEKRDKHRSRSGGSTASSDWLSDSDDSDVTDVSPLNTPHLGGRYERMSGKPPKNPDTGRSPASSRLDHLLQGNKDSMDLNLLMHAVLEMEKEHSEGLAPVPHKKFVVPPPAGSKLPRKNFSFQNEHVGHIDRENQRLMKEIMKCAIQAKEAKQKARCRSKPMQTSTRLTTSAVNRMKEQRRIEAENRAMLRRLQLAKPTKTVRHDDQLREYGKRTLFGTSVAAAHGLDAKKSPYGDGSSSGMRSHSMLEYRYDDDANSLISGGHQQPTSSVSKTRPSSAAVMSRTRPMSATSVTSSSSSTRPAGRRKPAPRPAWNEKW